MALNEQILKKENSEALLNPAATAQVAVKSYHQSYHELGEQHVVELDVLGQLRLHLGQLEELQNRFEFMVRELKGLIR